MNRAIETKIETGSEIGTEQTSHNYVTNNNGGSRVLSTDHIRHSNRRCSRRRERDDGQSVVDRHGFRFNVGMIITNAQGQVFWGRRYYGVGWQFPQGGLCPHESAQEAMFRELREETSLLPEQVELLAATEKWYFYTLPQYLRRQPRQLHQSTSAQQPPASANQPDHLQPAVVATASPKSAGCIGQRQRWFLLRLKDGINKIDVTSVAHPEFREWRWVDYWYPIQAVVFFKRKVYRQALQYLAPFNLVSLQDASSTDS